ncbi:MAG: hypothetical protein R3240_11190 [Gammaproteobacteria bacterium]|nr:hypothetical protein [Gammaproteobacteria bacterium]
MFVSRFRSLLFLLLPFLIFFSQPIFAADNERADVLKSFVGSQRGEMVKSYDEQAFQHKVMFIMGLALLIFVLLTAGFGIAMAMLGKETFLAHMICAGITVFLTIAHSVVAVVWFFPF